jgi:hypothetical protein
VSGVRVYVPATVGALQVLLERRQLPPSTAFAVTPALREAYAVGDQEELEYVAFNVAARASLLLLDDDPGQPRRRVVVACDVPDDDVAVRPDVDRAAVALGVPVSLAAVASLHVDAAEAEAAVAAAAEAVIAADHGTDDAAFTVDEAEGHELLWYATQELEPLLSFFDPPSTGE